MAGVHWLILTVALCSCYRKTDARESCGISVVLFGSTGDLARRYLWPAIFENFVGKSTPLVSECQLAVFGTTRSPVTDAEELWEEAWTNVRCSQSWSVSETECGGLISKFKAASQFVLVKTDEHYKELSERIQQFHLSQNQREVGRVFYLSVPPSAYSGIVKNIHLYSRPSSGWARVVLEKPFGHDLTSARALAKELSEYLSEEEIYRIDHYLGKLGVQQIVPFRRHNIDSLVPIWNHEHIDHVEIAVKERLDVKGRTKFYDKYGVIRDMMQNHLMELLVQVTADVTELQDFLQAKQEILSRVYTPRVQQAFLAQYDNYRDHLVEDGVVDSPENGTLTPTYASVLLAIKHPKWSQVPFVLTSGKKLGKRTAYVRVVFKQKSFSVSDWARKSCSPEIVFLIQDEEVSQPGVLISPHLRDFNWELPFVDWQMDAIIMKGGCEYSYYLHPTGEVHSNAYIPLIGAILDGRKEFFVDTQSLLESWRIWTPLLEQSRLTINSFYSPDTLGELDFTYWRGKLQPQPNTLVFSPTDMHVRVMTGDFASKFSELFGIKTYVSTLHDLAAVLADKIYKTALQATSDKGSFHLALPGGGSPIPLMESLVLSYASIFPWKSTHIWQTDERCVPHQSSDSNFRQLTEELLMYVPVPHYQVHAMPVEQLKGLCSNEDRGHDSYEATLVATLGDDGLDAVVLGVGSDGHIASLFPEGALHSVSEGGMVHTVAIKETYPVQVKQRMTLSFKSLLFARKIFVLLIGEKKRELFMSISNCFEKNSNAKECNYPVVDLMTEAKRKQLDLEIFVDIKVVP